MCVFLKHCKVYRLISEMLDILSHILWEVDITILHGENELGADILQSSIKMQQDCFCKSNACFFLYLQLYFLFCFVLVPDGVHIRAKVIQIYGSGCGLNYLLPIQYTDLCPMGGNAIKKQPTKSLKEILSAGIIISDGNKMALR